MSKEYPCVYWDDGKCKKFSDETATSWCVEAPCKDQSMEGKMTDREKVKERVRNAFANAAWHHALDPCEYVAEMLADELTFAKDANVLSKWIPVTERLPEDRELVLCFKKGGFGRRVAILTFAQSLEALHEYDFEGQKHSGFVNYDSEVGYYEVSGVTHWMPLPEPPKGDAE